MVSVNVRGWTFLDEDSAPDPESPRGRAVTAQATALMNEWSILHHEIDQEHLQLLCDRDDPMCDGGYDPRHCECEVYCTCEGHAHVMPAAAEGDEPCDHVDTDESSCPHKFEPCADPDCACKHLLDGDELCVHDRAALEEYEAREALREEGRRLRMRLIEAELAGMGARKMRAYEHDWNEDEAYVRYMEEGRFGHYSD